MGGKRKKVSTERMMKMATASFTKEFAIKDKKIARKILLKLKSEESTIHVAPSGIDINQTLARSEELLKRFQSR